VILPQLATLFIPHVACSFNWSFERL